MDWEDDYKHLVPGSRSWLDVLVRQAEESNLECYGDWEYFDDWDEIWSNMLVDQEKDYNSPDDNPDFNNFDYFDYYDFDDFDYYDLDDFGKEF